MPTFFIHLRNAEFRSRDEGGDYADANEALASGVASAAALTSDEINRGSRNAAIEVSVTGSDSIALLTAVVSTSVSILVPGNIVFQSELQDAEVPAISEDIQEKLAEA